MRKCWTKEEIDYLVNNYSVLSLDEIEKHINRSRHAIVNKASDLKIKTSDKWTREEEEYLKENFGEIPLEEICSHLNKSVSAVRTYAYRNVDGRYRWTQKESERLERLYGTVSNKRLARLMGKSETSIHNKAFYMGYGKPISFQGNLTTSEVSELLGMPPYKIRRFIYDGGLKSKKINKCLSVTIKDLSDWMQEHPDKWIPSKCDLDYFRNIEWFDELHRKELENGKN